MDSRTGKRIRLGRLIDRSTGRSVVVAASHGIQSGPPRNMGTRPELAALFPRLRAADGVMVSPGLVETAETTFVGRFAPGLVVHVDWKNGTRSVYPSGTDGRGEPVATSVADLEDVAAAGACGIMTYLHVGQEDTRLERDEVERNAQLARGCDRLGLACIIEPRSAREREDPKDATGVEVLSFACRMATEIGADIVKCVWPGSLENFAAIVEVCGAPVLLAGGPGGDDESGTIALAGQAVEAGASGVMFGRRVTGATDPADVLEKLRSAVHGEVLGPREPEDVGTRTVRVGEARADGNHESDPG